MDKLELKTPDYIYIFFLGIFVTTVYSGFRTKKSIPGSEISDFVQLLVLITILMGLVYYYAKYKVEGNNSDSARMRISMVGFFVFVFLAGLITSMNIYKNRKSKNGFIIFIVSIVAVLILLLLIMSNSSLNAIV